jgi:hypothetical protein
MFSFEVLQIILLLGFVFLVIGKFWTSKEEKKS